MKVRGDPGPHALQFGEAFFTRAAQFLFSDLGVAQRNIDLAQPRGTIVKNEGSYTGGRQCRKHEKPRSLPYWRYDRKTYRCRCVADCPIRINCTNKKPV